MVCQIIVQIRKNPHYESDGDPWLDPDVLAVLQLPVQSALYFTTFQKDFVRKFSQHTIHIQHVTKCNYKICALKGVYRDDLQRTLSEHVPNYPILKYPKKYIVNTQCYPHTQRQHTRFVTVTSHRTRKSRVSKHVSPVSDYSFITRLRMIKSTSDIDRIRTACKLTCLAITHIQTNVQNYTNTRDIYNAIYAFIQNHHPHNETFNYTHTRRKKQDLFAYSTILTVNGLCVHPRTGSVDLHPKRFRNVVLNSEHNPVLLLDVGVRYGGYCADITRTFPVYSYTPFQQNVYNSVKRLYTTGEQMVRPGVHFLEIQKVVLDQLQHELKALGIPDYKNIQKYMPHSLGHSVGLQVHDTPEISSVGELQIGMVLTIEPGIYLPEVCVRIENTLLVTKEGCEVLSKNAPW